MGYNRTYVELKPLCSHHNSPLGRGYNRTYVELKHACNGGGTDACRGYNRTYVELKLDEVWKSYEFVIRVIIALM